MREKNRKLLNYKLGIKDFIDAARGPGASVDGMMWDSPKAARMKHWHTSFAEETETANVRMRVTRSPEALRSAVEVFLEEEREEGTHPSEV